MANSAVSALAGSSALSGPELFYADNGVNDVKVTSTLIKTFTNTSSNFTATSQFLSTFTAVATPNYSLASDNAAGMYVLAAQAGIAFAGVSAIDIQNSANGVRIATTNPIGWPSGGSANSGALDTAIARSSVGIVEINNGTVGTYADLRLRNLIVLAGVIEAARFVVASLPTPGGTTAPVGSIAYSSNARKSGEGGGAGTGIPVWCDGTNWRTFYDNAVAAA